ncbi:hypothetical protein Tmar_0226 [Thermaerobacter marianensis DSM 12885]|uniref:Uncharacterized protein n=1 Tax=Thermaerobacter marianensis (strain ATCC 700841 / DSM 12885 / JCM 10246 / 7p75a) TaxID=644966 RepID=E6SM21_THEM7|nr:hypothetical protein Tmar_0226 [Thermaerobacter marianensis DSM 12885]
MGRARPAVARRPIIVRAGELAEAVERRARNPAAGTVADTVDPVSGTE